MEKKDDTNDVEFHEFLQSLEQQKNWDGSPLVKYHGIWYTILFFREELSSQKNFKAKDSDILLASLPKSGTTWLKALVFSIVNRNIYPVDQSPLLTIHPHTLVPFLWDDTYSDQGNPHKKHIYNNTQRIFSTHTPFKLLSDSIRESKCKIIYICRNPLDQFISQRQFLLENKLGKDVVPLGLDETFDMFCEGTHPYGPFWEQMIGYWNAHLENPDKVLFLKYEELNHDISFHVKKIAKFLGCPFSSEEEEKGLIEEISRLCSFNSLKSLEVNKNGYVYDGVLKNSSFFRKGEVGDWTNYLTPTMVERMNKLMEIKFQGSGLKFNT
ncbi:hypothetical protein ACP275_05G086300 [Erythranthe tilingii]